jgi:hypothetical protein
MTFVCLNEEMRQHRPTLFEILGSGAARCPDWVMVQAATGSGPLLFTGEAGCDLDRLARAVHAMSLRRSRPAVAVATVPRAPEFHPLCQQSICSQVVSGAPCDLEDVGFLGLLHVAAQRQQERSRDEPQQRSAGGSGFAAVVSA